MKKFFILTAFISSLSLSSSCKIINDLARSRVNKTKKIFILDKVTQYKVDKIDEMLTDVLKTDKQLIPKHCWYIAITNVKNEEFDLAKKAIEVAILANSTINPNLNIFIDKNQEALDKIIAITKKYNIKNVYFYSNPKELIDKILKIKGPLSTLDHRRILLLTSSKTMRVEYSKLIDTLEDNPQNMVIDNFAYLYNETREDYEFSTEKEIIDSFRQIKCK